MAMSQRLMSASEIGLPSPVFSAAAAPAPNATATRRAATELRVDMLDLPFVVDCPAGDAVVMLVGERERRRQRLAGLAALGDEVGAQRLHVAGFIPGATLQDRRLAIPAPRHHEAGERLGGHRTLQCGFAPA